MLAGMDDHLTWLSAHDSKFRKYGFDPFRIRDTGVKIAFPGWSHVYSSSTHSRMVQMQLFSSF